MNYKYFLGVGAMKAGTTLLYDLLRSHPQIRCGTKKELHYFNTALSPSRAEYDSLFSAGVGLKMDITPIYMYAPGCLDKICAILPPEETGVVVILRDPVERAISHYKMLLSQHQEKESLERCFELEPGRIAHSPHHLKKYSYFTRGLYAGQLDEVYAHFPKENIKIILFEYFIRNQQGAVDEICAFLGISPLEIKETHSNKSVVHVKSRLLARFMRTLSRITPEILKTNALRRLKYRLASLNEKKNVPDEMISPAFRQKLIDYYREDVSRLKSEYGIDTDKWKNFI